MKNLTIVSVLFLITFSVHYSASALDITSPPASGAKIACPHDYFTEVLGNPADMSGPEDLSNYITGGNSADFRNISNKSFSGGVFSFTITGSFPYFYMLSPGQSSAFNIGKNGQRYPIDSALYRYLTLRINPSVPGQLRVTWHTGTNYASNSVTISPVNIKSGWHVYTIDLQTTPHESFLGQDLPWNAKPVTGLRIQPLANAAGETIKVDYIQLTDSPGASGKYTINTTFAPVGDKSHYSIFIDNDTNPTNGFIARPLTASGVQTPATVSSLNLFPGSYSVVGFEHYDYALLNGDPWDMNNAADVEGVSGITTNTSSFADGTFSGTTTSSSPFFFVNTPTEIDTSSFKYFSMGATYSKAGRANIYWFNSSNQLMGYTFFDTSPGYNIYTVDLSTVPSWNGKVGRVRVGVDDNPNTTFSVSYVSLSTKSNFVQSEAELSPTTAAAPGKLTVNSPPQVYFYEPDLEGPDFASSVLGDAWKMDGVSDIASVFNLDTAEILPDNYVNGSQGSFFRARNKNGNNDPQNPFLDSGDDSGSYIDASRYLHLCWRFFLNRSQDVVNGSTMRVIWRQDSASSYINGDDIFPQDGWNTYCADLRNIQLEASLHPPGSVPVPFFSGNIHRFQIDPHEFSDATEYYFDYVRLSEIDPADSLFAIAYSAADSDDDPSDVLTTFYRTTANTPTGGTAIASSLPLSTDSRIVLFDTSSLPNGEYKIYAVITDGFNKITRMAPGSIKVDHSRPQNTSPPALDLYWPTGNTVFSDSLTVYGSAVDDVETALVEVFVDSKLLCSFVPSIFDKTASDAHPDSIDSDQAGFYNTCDTSSLPNGQHSLQIKATDAAGNQTTLTGGALSIIKSAAGTDTPPSFPGGTNAAPIGISLDNGVLTLKRPRYKAKKDMFIMKLVDADECSGTIEIKGAKSKLILSDSPSDAITLTKVSSNGSNYLMFKKKGPNAYNSKNGTGKIFFAAYCDGSLANIVRFNGASIKNSKKTVGGWRRFVRKIRKRLKVKRKN